MREQDNASENKSTGALRRGICLGTLRRELQLDERHFAAMIYAESITRRIKVSDETFTRVREVFTEREVVELTATISMYNGVSRFLVALDVGEDIWDEEDSGDSSRPMPEDST